MDKIAITDILLELLSASGVSGDETAAVEIAERYLKPYAPEIKRDRFGNLLAFRPGTRTLKKDKITLAIVAHIDEIGAMVTKIEEGGFLRFTGIGGFDARTLPGQTVEVFGKRKRRGVIGASPPHILTEKEKRSTIPMNKLFIDLGLDEKTVKREINVGDRITLEQEPVLMSDSRMITGKALDDRAGVATLIACASELSGLQHSADICFIASMQEEVGLRGAITAAYGLNPDLAVAVDVTHGDMPKLEAGSFYKLGGGPALAVGPNLHPLLSRHLQELAAAHFLPYQIEAIPGRSGTDAWAFQVSREGIPTALLSLPLRYMHTAVEMINLDDLKVSARLLSYFARSVDSSLLEELKKC
ncbi:MAG: M42 family metallopeptidase [Bacillota bacterium]|nr:M42 family metallopeptidase [Bacillota bacterium]